MATQYLDQATGEWVSWEEYRARQRERSGGSISINIIPEWLRRREEDEKPQDVEVIGSEPLRRPALPPPRSE